MVALSKQDDRAFVVPADLNVELAGLDGGHDLPLGLCVLETLV